jgi:hypothetical protein
VVEKDANRVEALVRYKLEKVFHWPLIQPFEHSEHALAPPPSDPLHVKDRASRRVQVELAVITAEE